MRNSPGFILLMLLLVASCTLPNRLLASKDSMPSYAAAIAKITAEPQQWAMRQCVKNWAVTSEERQSAFASNLGALAGAPIKHILLEIGNSGFPSYSYIFVANNRLRSSLQKDKYISLEEVSELYRLAFSTHQTEVWADIEDGDCYFLTIIDGDNKKTILSYGVIRSLPQDSLIKRLILMAK